MLVELPILISQFVIGEINKIISKKYGPAKERAKFGWSVLYRESRQGTSTGKGCFSQVGHGKQCHMLSGG